MKLSALTALVKKMDFASVRRMKYFYPMLILCSFVLLVVLSPVTGYRIISPSMDPTIKVNDVVIVNRLVNKSTIQEGDIIAFRTFLFNPNEKEVIVHYVHSVAINEEGKRVFKTISEGAELPDRWEIEERDVIGIYLFKIPGVGRIIEFFQSPFGIIVIVVDIGLIYFFSNMSENLTKQSKKLEQTVKVPKSSKVKSTKVSKRKTTSSKKIARGKKSNKNEKEKKI